MTKKLVISILFMFSASVQASQDLDVSTSRLLQTAVVIKRDVPKGTMLDDEVNLIATASSVPVFVELLTNHGKTNAIIPINRSMISGTYTLQDTLKTIAKQGSNITWKIVDNSVFLIIKADADLDDPLDIKIPKPYTNNLTLQGWVTWLYRQAPISGLDLESPDATRDERKIYCHIKAGETIRSVFAELTKQTGGLWNFHIEENNHILGGPKPPDGSQMLLYTDTQMKYLHQPATGDQLGRTQVYYYTH